MHFRHWPEPPAAQPLRAACRHRPAQRPGQATPVSCTKIPTFRNRPRRDGRLSWPCWLTDSRRFTHKVVKQPSISLAQDRESSPARTDVLTTVHLFVSVFLSMHVCLSVCLPVCLDVSQGRLRAVGTADGALSILPQVHWRINCTMHRDTLVSYHFTSLLPVLCPRDTILPPHTVSKVATK